jgi:hypothetical protein
VTVSTVLEPPTVSCWYDPMGREKSALRKKDLYIKNLVQAVPVPDPFTLQGLVDAVGAHTGKPFLLAEVDIPTSSVVCGMTLTVADLDAEVIVYPANAQPWHQVLIVLHELGHRMMAHEKADADEGIVEILAPSFDPDMVLAAIGRSRYDQPAEHDAESFARQLLVRVQKAAAPHARPAADANVAAAIARFDDTFGL